MRIQPVDASDVPCRVWQILLLQATDAKPFAELLWQTLFARRACLNWSTSQGRLWRALLFFRRGERFLLAWQLAEALV